MNYLCRAMAPVEKHIESLFNRYYRPLCLFALHYVEETEAAEDIVQDAFVALWERSPEVRDPKSYLFTSVRNACLSWLRQRNNVADTLLETIPEEEQESRADEEARLWSAIDALPRKRRQIFLLAKRDGFKYEEIATRLGISVHTVRNQMSKALAALKGAAHKIYSFFFCAG